MALPHDPTLSVSPAGRATHSVLPDPAVTQSVANPGAITGGDSASALTNPPLASAGRYQLGDEIARGGMGVIYRANDTAFGREVAVKVLQDQYGPTSGAARRFADEARITGQLQHPAVPPVHDLGTLPDGRPFLAMKLIKGQTLDDLLKERTAVSADRGRFVAAFEQVCQAVAYAHAHKVIHRDLKPANVMVGSFGEVQVMDWGLAKVLTANHAEIADPNETVSATAIQSLRESDGSFTQSGSVLGTPAFMPPEQAVGAVGKIDARSDVFGLGAILAVILTGQPPFAGSSLETTRIQAAQGNVEECFARLDSSGAEPEFVTLCKRCLNPKLADRPADAGELAKAIAELRAEADERARRAELDRVSAEGQRAAAELRLVEQRKRRRVQLALVAAIGVLLVGGGTVGWYVDRQAGERRAERDHLAGEQRTADLRRQLEDEQREATEAARRGRNAEAVAGLIDRVENALRGGDTAKAGVLLEAAEKRAAEGGADELAGRLELLRNDWAASREFDLVDQFRWTRNGKKFRDPKAVSGRFRAALGRFGADPERVPVEEAKARVSRSAIRNRFIEALDQLLQTEPSVQIRAALRAIDPYPFRDSVRDAVAAGNGTALAELVGWTEAAEQPPEFVAILGENPAIPVERQRVLLLAAVRRRPADLQLLLALGHTYPIEQRSGAMERLRWYQAAVAAAPGVPVAHSELGTALLVTGDFDGAAAAYQEAIRLDPTYAIAYSNLGAILCDHTRDYDGAVAAFKEAIRLDPTHAVAYSNLGCALAKKKDYAGAVVAFNEAIRLDPKNAETRTMLGNVLSEKQDLDGAVAVFREAVRLNQKDAGTHRKLGDALYTKGDYDGAVAAYKEAIRLDPKDAVAHSNLGGVLCDHKRDYAGAAAVLKEAIRLDPTFADAHSNLGVTLYRKKDYVGAASVFRDAIRLDPKNAKTHSMLGNVLNDKSDYDGAVAAFQEAIRLDPKNADSYSNMGSALLSKNDFEGAVEAQKQAIRLDPNDANYHAKLGAALYSKKDVDGAVKALKEALRLDPELAHVNIMLGLLLRESGRFVEAVTFLRRGHSLGIQQPDWTIESAQLVAQCEQQIAERGLIAPAPRQVKR